MRLVSLTPEIQTTCLGFGTATLARLDSHKSITRMLGEALDAGILHFDTAGLYGHGTMEGLLGNFLQGKRDQVTIATKFGLEPPLRAGSLSPLLHRIKGAVKRVGFLRNRARALAAKTTIERRDAKSARNSLERSLRELKTDYLDLFFVHEGSPAEAADEALLTFLETEKAAGKIRAFGLAANFTTTAAVPDAVLQRYDVVQIPSDILNANLDKLSGRVRGAIITHSVFAPLEMLAERLAQSERLRLQWEGRLGVDLRDTSALPRLLLQSVLAGNPQSVTLFSATKEAHIRSNAAAAEQLPSEAQRTLLREMISELAH
jgi:D-threo-aldose 1-dehydrogenase